MLNAAIVMADSSRFPKLLSFLKGPKVEDVFSITIGEETIRAYVISIPVMEEPRLKARMAKAFSRLCDGLDIELAAAGSAGLPAEVLLGWQRGGLGYEAMAEVQAIKTYAAVLKLSGDTGENLLWKNIGFAVDEINQHTLDILSEDAACVMLYESGSLTAVEKKAVFDKLIRKKGISAVFTKDLGGLIKACDVIIVDEKTQLAGLEAMMAGKLILGKCGAAGLFRKAESVILWNEPLKDTTESNRTAAYNDALLTVARQLYGKDSYVEFIRRFPYIYLKGSGVLNS